MCAKFPTTALYGIRVQGLICRPFLVGTLFAPTQGSHFQALHLLRFFFICTLHWCKRCTVLEIAENVRKFPMTALCGIAAQELICGPVLVDALFTPTQCLHFHALHPLSILFICTLHWCKHFIVLEETTDMRKISNDGAMRNNSAGTNLQALPGRYGFCTDTGFTFSGSPSP